MICYLSIETLRNYYHNYSIRAYTRQLEKGLKVAAIKSRERLQTDLQSENKSSSSRSVRPLRLLRSCSVRSICPVRICRSCFVRSGDVRCSARRPCRVRRFRFFSDFRLDFRSLSCFDLDLVRYFQSFLLSHRRTASKSDSYRSDCGKRPRRHATSIIKWNRRILRSGLSQLVADRLA